MGFWSTIDARVNGLPPASSQLGISIDTWHDSQLETIVLADILGTDAMPVLSRSGAMRVPAVARARHLIAGTIARVPLVALRRDTPVDPQPTWIAATDGQLGDYRGPLVPDPRFGQSPWLRALCTVDDLLFYGGALWLVTARSQSDGYPLRLVHVDRSLWDWHPDNGFVDVDGQPLAGAGLAEADLIYIPGPHEGLLCFAQVTLAQALDMERAASDVAAHPFRLELHQVTETPLTDDQKRAMVSAARKAMSVNGGVLFTNSAIETKDHPISSGDLLIAGRNQTAVDIARDASIPATLLDASGAGASLTYETALTRNAEFLDYGLQPYMDALTARLSMDDVVPAGQRVAYDTTALTSLPLPATGPTLDD